jgi:hypothetical protein
LSRKMKREVLNAARALPLAVGALALAAGACGASPDSGAGEGAGAGSPAPRTSGSHTPAPFEAPPTLQASDLAPAALVKGPKHELGATVQGDGFMTTWTVKSEFGTWEAFDRETVEVRVREVYSLDKLDDVSKGEIFAKAFAQAAGEKAEAIKHVVDDPVGTVKAIPGSVARFAKGVGRVTKKGIDKVTADKEGPDDRTTEEKAADAAGAAASSTESALIGGKRREWAEKVGADPYTTNPSLKDKLDDVGWAAYAGGFALNVAVPSIPGLGLVTTTDRLIYDMPPGELEKRNLDKLEAAGVGDEARQELILNSNFTLTLQTGLAEAIAALGEAEGKTEIVALAAGARTEGDAWYARRCAQLLAAGAKEVGGWTSLHATENEIEAVAADGRVVMPWAVDYMTWNEEAIPADSPRFEGAESREIWISGIATDLAKTELAALGFEVRENMPLK